LCSTLLALGVQASILVIQEVRSNARELRQLHWLILIGTGFHAILVAD